MKTKVLVSLLLISSVLLFGCKKDVQEDQSIAPGEVAKWNDRNFHIIGAGAYNYTDYDIYDVLVLPPDKSDIKFAASTHGGRALPRGEDRWVVTTGGASLAWDLRWATPKKFKVVWFRVVDREVYSSARKDYDKYSMKETRPGAAWCEGEIEVMHPPHPEKGGDLIIHYYPDGHIEGDVDYSTEDASRVDIKKRNELPVLKDRACLKEVQNPYFGKKKPIQMN